MSGESFQFNEGDVFKFEITPKATWIIGPTGVVWGPIRHNPLAAMCHHKDTHSTARLPVSTAKEAPAGIFAVSGFDHRPGAWK